jgi:hypothetical protein
MAHETGKIIAASDLFGPAINGATMQDMEADAASNERGIERRLVLLGLARDAATLARLSVDNPELFGQMRESIENFTCHARTLLEAAESAKLRMRMTDCRDGFPPLDL